MFGALTIQILSKLGFVAIRSADQNATPIDIATKPSLLSIWIVNAPNTKSGTAALIASGGAPAYRSAIAGVRKPSISAAPITATIPAVNAMSAGTVVWRCSPRRKEKIAKPYSKAPMIAMSTPCTTRSAVATCTICLMASAGARALTVG